MDNKNTRRWAGLAAASVLALLAGCGGGGGSSDPTPTTPPPVVEGPPVTVPTGTSPITLTSNTPAATFAALNVKVNVGKVTTAGAPVVHFSLTDQDGNAIIGFGSTSKSSTATLASYPNLAFSMAKLVPGTNGSPSKWVSYIVTTVPTTTAAAAPTRPSTDNTGTLVDNKNGTYAYTFYRDVTKIKDQVAAMTVTGVNNKADLGDLTFEPNLTHRLTIQISGNAPGTGTNTANAVQVTTAVPMKNPVDVIHDFIPATGKPVSATDTTRDIASTAKCNECHRKLGGIPGDSAQDSAASFHGGSRNEVRYCVVCHTDQRRYGRTEATVNTATNTFTSTTYVVDGRTVGNLPNFIHKVHLGGILAKKNYDYGGVKANEVHYPQDIRNCTKCHDGSATSTAKTAQGDNWKAMPSKLACGSCHDGINFTTGKGVTLADAAKGLTTSTHGHVGGAQADDSLCVLCHKAATNDINHLPVTPPNLASALHVAGGSANTNSAWIASNTARLPEGAVKVSYDIKSVARNASKQPVMVFRMLQNGARKDLNVPSATVTEVWDNFMGSPSVYFVFAVPQDGIAAPTDFNASASGYLRSLWNGTSTGTGKGTLTGPDADGYYTATLTGVTIPDNAVMLTGGVGYSYNVTSTLPLTQINLPDYPVAASPIGAANKVGGLIVITPNVQKVATGYSPRRAIVEDARCNSCHQELGTFTEEAFHGGQRNDGTTCSWCHTPNRASSGWSADSTAFVHAIHANAKRTVKYNWHALSPTEGFYQIHYPGILSQCEACHLPGTYDFSNASSSAAMAGRPFRTVVSGTLASTGTTYSYAPYITKDLNYGSGFSFNAGTGATTAAAGTTLVTSPTATVCFACHDSALATTHMQTNGGSIYEPRSTALAKGEQCELCHASGKVADIKVMHNK
ncbi:MAG: OmcA/MtrC family decaheme c-type cytochrome [Burkholderiales bacterium]|nr:OmcA/MtrC family decaheme c-type cytochrome [Burkholderiales bacterium]